MPTSAACCTLIRPDVHCKGTDYTVETVPERDVVRGVRRPHCHRRRPQGSRHARPPRADQIEIYGCVTRVLIVRLGALGDIVHAIPVAAALRRAYPSVRIDWLVSAKHREILDLVPVIDHRLRRGRIGLRSLFGAIRELRRNRYDVALDLQGLIKSAVIARSSGAGRVIGFSSQVSAGTDGARVLHGRARSRRRGDLRAERDAPRR